MRKQRELLDRIMDDDRLAGDIGERIMEVFHLKQPVCQTAHGVKTARGVARVIASIMSNADHEDFANIGCDS